MLSLCIMSALPVANWITNVTPMWLGNLGAINQGFISSMSTDQIVLDGQTLDATSDASGTLLINGIAIASAATLTSSITNWATFPALSTIRYTTSGGTGGTINMSSGQFSTINNTSSITAGKISATTVNALNIQTSVTNDTGTSVTLAAGTAQVLESTTPTFSFVSGSTYLVTIPFGAAYSSPSFQGSNVEGDIKFFGCSPTAFPIVANGVTPGTTYTVFNSATSLNSIFGSATFVATAAATATESLSLAAVVVGGLSGVTINASTNPTAISRIAVVRLT